MIVLSQIHQKYVHFCKDCKYFVKHYCKDKFGRFVLIDGAGHCKNPDLTFTANKKAVKTGNCEYFQPEEARPQDKKRLIVDKLKHAKLLLSDVTRILNEDKT